MSRFRRVLCEYGNRGCAIGRAVKSRIHKAASGGRHTRVALMTRLSVEFCNPSANLKRKEQGNSGRGMPRVINRRRNVNGMLMITITRCPSLILVSAVVLVIAIVPMLAIGLHLSVVVVPVLRDRGPHGLSADRSRERECECNPADTNAGKSLA